MALADTFQQIVDSLPDDWSHLELDLRIADEARYIDAATLLVTCNAQPYSKHDWHFKLMVAHRFGHAAAAPTVHGCLKLLDDAGIGGELALRETRRADELVGEAKTLAFYSHVDADVRRRALAAGFDLVVPRSRMAREG